VLLPVLEDRLYVMSSENADLPSSRDMDFFTMDKVMKYIPFCADHGYAFLCVWR